MYIIGISGQNIGRITKATIPLRLLISGNHQEEISLLIIDTPHLPVILGYPWRIKHSPEVDWGKHEILGWNTLCATRCLQKALLAAVPRLEAALILATVPVEYHDLKEVFCKSRAMCLPPHRPYDCAIDLKSGTTPSRGRLFSLSRPETEVMEKYLSESLAAGIIRPSSSPAGAGFFFVGKKDGSLRPCINKITIKNQYPPPSDDYRLLQGATIFTKLDLRNATWFTLGRGTNGRRHLTHPLDTGNILLCPSD